MRSGDVEARMTQRASDGFAGGTFFDGERGVQAVRVDTWDVVGVAKVMHFAPPVLVRTQPVSVGRKPQLFTSS